MQPERSGHVIISLMHSSEAPAYAGTQDYIAGEALMQTVNVAVALRRPLLIKGEPGTGKTMLAESIARALNLDLLAWNIKSTTKAQDGLYVYDTVQRLYDSQFGDTLYQHGLARPRLTLDE